MKKQRVALSADVKVGLSEGIVNTVSYRQLFSKFCFA